MSLSRQIAHNTILQSVGKIIATILGVIAFSLMTRYLDTAGFGAYTTIASFLQFFGIIADCGLSLMAIQMMSEVGRDEGRTFQTAFTLRLGIVVASAIAAPLVVFFFPYPPLIKIGIAAMALSFVLSSLIQMLRVVYQVRLRMDIPLLADTVSALVLVASIAIAIAAGGGLLGIIAAITVNNIVQLGILLFPCARFVPVRLLVDRAIAREMFSRSWPIALSIILNLMYLRTDAIILSMTHPQETVGLYGAAYRIIDVLASFPTMFMGITLASFAKSYSAGDRESFARYFQKTFDAIAIMALPLIVGTQFLATQVIVFLSGSSFAPAGDILRVLIVACGTLFFGTFFAHLINVIHAQRTMLFWYFVTAILGVSGYLYFIPRFSYWGAAWMTVLAEALVTIAAAGIFFATTRVVPRLETLCKSLLACGAMAFVLMFSKNQSLAFLIPLACVSYTAALFALGGAPRRLIVSAVKR
ncbi:flippase [Candidatus Uhrbacteria bacterium]|nr:flippase [Candidatus Uhrbacteria bacterium]